MIVSLAEEAEVELTDGAIFYATHGDYSLGVAFISEFENVLHLITEHPELGTPWRAHSRRFPLRRFPCSVIYRIDGDQLRVVAIAHQRRRPGYWSGRK